MLHAFSTLRLHYGREGSVSPSLLSQLRRLGRLECGGLHLRMLCRPQPWVWIVVLQLDELLVLSVRIERAEVEDPSRILRSVHRGDSQQSQVLGGVLWRFLCDRARRHLSPSALASRVFLRCRCVTQPTPLFAFLKHIGSCIRTYRYKVFRCSSSSIPDVLIALLEPFTAAITDEADAARLRLRSVCRGANLISSTQMAIAR